MALLVQVTWSRRDEAGELHVEGSVVRRPHPYFETRLDRYVGDTVNDLHDAGVEVEIGTAVL
jgi:hypothetical protein